MFEYEMHQVRSAELIRQADEHRRARAALADRKTRKAERSSTTKDAEGPVSTGGPRRSRFARTA
ncbi:hypothetical protein ACN2WE_28310 [Streptomyces sp. cg28]|uniref:hypothetical protein n=1 Tax=unclassified Streptomyces TaxID=2593676 RepID=UPI000DB9D429|nr:MULTISPECIES: hypothetical protein [unclassified Streptomyces]MYT69581.1 hypothetical protein [Streptomyces sp. SID8367]RAJ74131.1 hypothetical protein K377_06793 [Streptomyces sp. PsTaAH-137]